MTHQDVRTVKKYLKTEIKKIKMLTIDLTEINLFEDLLQIELQDKIIDIHNDYDLKKINLLPNISLQLIFQHSENKNEIYLVFEEVEFIEFEIRISTDLTIDNFYRGRYEFEKKLYDDFNDKKCFYIDFCEVGQINLLCSKLLLKT